MAHVMKLKLGQVAPLHRHSTREMEATRERDNIDPELTHCNYTIGQPFDGGWQANIQDCIEIHNSNGRNIRSDAVVAASWVITQPQELPDEYRRDFFAACHDFLEQRYGAAHVDQGYVHLDESRAHMHTQIDMLNDATGRLQGSKIISRTDLQTFHRDLERHCCKALGLERVGVELTKEQRGARELDYQDIKSYQAAKDELARTKEQVAEAKVELTKAQQDTKAEVARSECLRRDNAAAVERVGELREQVERARGGLGGQGRRLGREAAEAVQRGRQGAHGDDRSLAELRDARAELERRVGELESRRDAAAGRVEGLTRAYAAAQHRDQQSRAREQAAQGRIGELRERVVARLGQLKESLGLDHAREVWQAVKAAVGVRQQDMGDAAQHVSAVLARQPQAEQQEYSARDWARYEQDRGMER